MRGIEFKYKTSYEVFLSKLLKDIEFENYDFYLNEMEIHCDEVKLNDFLEKMNGLEFEKCIKEENYFLWLLNLKIYKKNDKTIEINVYDDFKDSNCKMILLVIDNEFIEIYFNSEKLQNRILNNLDSLNISYQIKTKENDGRTKMSII